MEDGTRPSANPYKTADACAIRSTDKYAALSCKEAANGSRRIASANRAPQDVIQLVVVDLVGLAEVHALGTGCGGRARTLSFIQRPARLLGIVGLRVRPGCDRR